MTRCLISGISGLLGSYLMRVSESQDEVHGTHFNNSNFIPNRLDKIQVILRMDILNSIDIARVFDIVQPDLVIHCAGEGRAWMAEQKPREAHELNVIGTINLLTAAHRHAAHFVYISTNAVYDGKNPPYNENSPLSPVNAYGRIKAEAEGYVRDYRHRKTIIRPIQLYGWPPIGARQNMASLIVQELRQGYTVNVATDLIVQPTYAEDVARAIWQVVKQQDTDEYILNVAAREKMSLYDFAKEVCREFNLDVDLLRPTINEQMTTPRPLDTCFDTTKLERLGINMRDVKTGLAFMGAMEP